MNTHTKAMLSLILSFALIQCNSEGDSSELDLSALQDALGGGNFLTGDFSQEDYADHVGEGHSPGFRPLPSKEAELAELNAMADATSSGTITASGTESCPGGGTIEYDFSANFTINTFSDALNKEGTVDSGIRTLTFTGCSPHPGLTINTGTLQFTQIGSSNIVFAQSGSTVTVTSTDKVFTLEGSMNGTHNPPPDRPAPPEGLKADMAMSVQVTEDEKIAEFDSSASPVEEVQPVSVKGSIEGVVTHSTPRGDMTETIDETFEKTF